MENLSLKDRRRRQSVAFASKSDNYDRYLSRLPTPDESIPSYRSSDDEHRNKVTRRHSPDHHNLHALNYSDRQHYDMSFPQTAAQRRVPDSPPYGPSDAQKPSLPPLKTVLANSLTSPPRSPIFGSASVQPSPQEPTYMSATYKPPALYPQKKQRTEYRLEPVAPFCTNESLPSPLFKQDAFNRTNDQAPPQIHMVSPRERFADSRRLSLQPRQVYSLAASPRAVPRRLQRMYVEPSPRPLGTVEGEARNKANSTAMSSSAYGSQNVRQGVAQETSPRNDIPRRFERRDSTQASYEPGYAEIDRQRDLLVPDTNQARRGGAGNESYDSLDYGRHIEVPLREGQPQAHYGPYQAQQPSFFMPSQYDYRHGRARKRSNLPKQSTEIMKTWFDQNITNPYPSEEQKAVFSNATGISMTQVSNWFINHRRRCPELRDKRERTRGRECDI